MAEDGKFRVEKFNDQNFSLWKMQMEDYLYQKDLYLPLGRKTKMLTGMTYEEWNLLDRKALGTVQLCLPASVAFNILKETTTKGLIKTLEKLYEKPSASNKVLDSGASFHATPEKKYFHDSVQGDFGQVRLGDDKPCKIVGMGKVLVKKQDGNQWLLKKVRHVPDLKKNLISTGQLGGEGCVTTFTDKAWKVTKGALVIAKGKKVGTLYLCNGISNSINALTSKGADATLWHHRLGHE
eukprot:PITA_26572